MYNYLSYKASRTKALFVVFIGIKNLWTIFRIIWNIHIYFSNFTVKYSYTNLRENISYNIHCLDNEGIKIKGGIKEFLIYSNIKVYKNINET